ncbi:MAG: heavy-metal-associated domain-containing protein [Gemmatimonadota bacterium]
MRVAVEKLPGVTEAEVSLESGLVAIQLSPVNEVSIADVREAIRNQGFSPRAAAVRVAGLVEQAPYGVVLRVHEAEAYPVTASAEMQDRLRKLIGEEVLLLGDIPRTDDAGDRVILHVTGLAEP